jgi:hypothetical protein
MTSVPIVGQVQVFLSLGLSSPQHLIVVPDSYSQEDGLFVLAAQENGRRLRCW